MSTHEDRTKLQTIEELDVAINASEETLLARSIYAQVAREEWVKSIQSQRVALAALNDLRRQKIALEDKARARRAIGILTYITTINDFEN